MATHNIITREATKAEKQKIYYQTKIDKASWIFIFIFFGLISFILLGSIFGWIGEVGAIGLFIIISIKFYKYEQELRKRAEKDYDNITIEEIIVESDKVYEICSIDNNDPILAFDIGENKVLYLQGQWIRDWETYNLKEDPSISDEGDDFINGLAPPYAFPTDKFIIIRSSHIGEVFSIKLLGEYIEPIETLDVLEKNEFNMSEILIGDIRSRETYELSRTQTVFGFV